ncbi:hypothetical protein DXT89_10570 [Agrobacterium vitis]|uniref:Uncharacterized protein n=1 Tax=Agrobacterium vitis TaxID=373 RepID=A0A368NV97_AGRVI|nr:hypothetical protein DXM22_13245 [Agrobacterium vitis]KAA3528442.1 hypothetical protein DXT89_10570 [Agrobacterium vitis]RCU54477.1 hypothetical protein ASB66_005275 [Agrobacterium vitis]
MKSLEKRACAKDPDPKAGPTVDGPLIVVLASVKGNLAGRSAGLPLSRQLKAEMESVGAGMTLDVGCATGPCNTRYADRKRTAV